MNRRPRLFVTAAVGATAALLLTACGGGDEKPKANDKIAGADTGSETSASPEASATKSAGRPKIELPSDLHYNFEWRKTGDKDKDAVLADSEQSIKAVDLAIANQDALDKAYLFYYEGEAAAETQKFIEAYVKAKARTTGAYRYYDAAVNVDSSGSASLVYCEDQSKAYDMYLKPKKVDRTAVTKNSYVLYNTQLHKDDRGVWTIEKLLSQRGSAKCQP
ncbi:MULTISPECIES: hypothetical protein [unclassified Streptomyces]|uniref:hypothetical protein n=1 Tax=unclassified Streptomyces TaxID=2593676 RepID=UPI002257E28C|nr:MULTISPECIES: hypothetical protein [unclassified Streptomyces]MCX4990576.1 hypothetical protein [Streptomyces sp. NBC_00568]MCX5004193.1 hypothetical protein [Streptomyces sp. NBC_00638]